MLALASAEGSALSPLLSADLDGDGSVETVLAKPARDAVRLQIRDRSGKKLAEAKAAAPDADVVHVVLTSAPLGSAGALLEVAASTDAAECRTVWRYRAGALTRLLARDASGKALPDCGTSAQWSYRWERQAEERPSAWVRERTAQVAGGTLRRKDAFAFAGFSLDYDPKLSSSEINGIPIPAWYRAVLYTRTSLERLYGRFDLASLRSEPTLSIETDRDRGVFALRFTTPEGELSVPVEAYASPATGETATLVARAPTASVHVSIRLGSEGTVPLQARVQGLGPLLDQVYAPAGSWRGGARQVFPTAADEIASEDLAGVWGDPRGKNTTIAIEGAPPYRVRLGPDTFIVDMEHATPPTDLLLLPAGESGRPFGILLRGPNAMEKIPFTCSGDGPNRSCRADGPGETLRRIGARMNVR